MTEWIQTLAETDKQLRNSDSRQSKSNKLKIFVQKETCEYMNDLKAAFSAIIKEFNANKAEQDSSIKLYNIEATHNDFMLFRGITQLSIQYKKPGHIHINIQNIHAYQNTAKDILNVQLSMALGNFEEVIWLFDRKPVNMDSLLKYLTKNFVHISC